MHTVNRMSNVPAKAKISAMFYLKKYCLKSKGKTVNDYQFCNIILLKVYLESKRKTPKEKHWCNDMLPKVYPGLQSLASSPDH